MPASSLDGMGREGGTGTTEEQVVTDGLQQTLHARSFPFVCIQLLLAHARLDCPVARQHVGAGKAGMLPRVVNFQRPPSTSRPPSPSVAAASGQSPCSLASSDLLQCLASPSLWIQWSMWRESSRRSRLWSMGGRGPIPRRMAVFFVFFSPFLFCSNQEINAGGT